MKRLRGTRRDAVRTGFAVGGAVLLLGRTSPSGAGQEESIKIGLPISMSPPGSVVQGKEVRDGADLAAKLVNDAGGVLGRPLELLYEDTSGLPDKGRAAVEKLITSDNVIAITGEHQSSVTLADMEVAHRYGIPLVNTNAWSDAVREKGYGEVTNPTMYNSRIAEAMAETIVALGAKRVVALVENTDYGIGQGDDVQTHLDDMGASVDYSVQVLDRTGRDYTPAVLELSQNPPDLVLTIMLPPAGYLIINQLYEQGIAPSPDTLIFEGAGIADYPDFWDNVQEGAEYMLNVGLYHPKMELTEFGTTIRETYMDQYGHEPSRLIFQAADCIRLIQQAIETAGSTDKEALVKTLQDSNVEGTRGTITFSKEEGITYLQWVDIPWVVYQITEVGQDIADTVALQLPGQELDESQVQRP